MRETVPVKADEAANHENDDVLRNLPVQESVRRSGYANAAAPARPTHETPDAHRCRVAAQVCRITGDFMDKPKTQSRVASSELVLPLYCDDCGKKRTRWAAGPGRDNNGHPRERCNCNCDGQWVSHWAHFSRRAKRVRCPSCGNEMQAPLTRKTSDRAGGPNKYEKLWMCQEHGYLRNGKVSRDPYGEDI